MFHPENEQYFTILDQGVPAWNAWRQQHFNIYLDFSHEDFSHRNLRLIDFTNIDLSGANLCGTNLSEALLTAADLSGANMQQANLAQASLNGTNMQQANLAQASLYNANLNYADLSLADCSQAMAMMAHFHHTTMPHARFTAADLRHAHLCSVNMLNTDLSNAQLGDTTFSKVYLHQAHGLETITHSLPSSLDIETAVRSAKHFPRTFLQGVGWSETLIATFQGSETLPISEHIADCPSCFLTIDPRDMLFAQQLHDDLQQAGIRCWIDREDTLDEPFRFSRPHLLILSHQVVHTPLHERLWAFRTLNDSFIDPTHFHEGIQLIIIQLDDSIFWQRRKSPELPLPSSEMILDWTQRHQADQYQILLSNLIQRLQKMHSL